MRSSTPPDSPPESQNGRNTTRKFTLSALIWQRLPPKRTRELLVTYHRIYHMEIQDNTRDVEAEMARRNTAILQEIHDAGYEGVVVNGQDLDVF